MRPLVQQPLHCDQGALSQGSAPSAALRQQHDEGLIPASRKTGDHRAHHRLQKSANVHQALALELEVDLGPCDHPRCTP